MSDICIKQKFGKVHMEGTFVYENGTKIFRKTNNPDKIKGLIKFLCESIENISVSKNNLLFVCTGYKVLIEDYPDVLKHDVLSSLKQFLPRKHIRYIEEKQSSKIKNLVINISAISILATCVLSGSLLEKARENIDIKPVTQPLRTLQMYNTVSIPITEKSTNSEISSSNDTTYEHNFWVRLSQVEDLQQNELYKIGVNVDQLAVSNFLSSPRGYILIKTAERYGVDPYLLLAKAITESKLLHEEVLPGGSKYNYGFGIMQIDTPQPGKMITAFDFNINELVTLELNQENVSDYEKNVQAGAMIMQNILNKYNHNIFLAIQTYNYGEGMISSILNKYAVSTNQTVENVINNSADLGWLELVEDAHINPNNYISNWSGNTYGDPNYLKKVLENFIGDTFVNFDKDGNIISSNILASLQSIENKNHLK